MVTLTVHVSVAAPVLPAVAGGTVPFTPAVLAGRLATKRTIADTELATVDGEGSTRQVPLSPGPTRGVQYPPGVFARRTQVPLARISMPLSPPVVEGPPKSEGPEHWLQVPTRSCFSPAPLTVFAGCGGSPQAAGVRSWPGLALVVGVGGDVVGGTVVALVVGVGDDVVGAPCVVGVTSDVVGDGLETVVGLPGPPEAWWWPTVPVVTDRWEPEIRLIGESGLENSVMTAIATTPPAVIRSRRTRRIRAARL
jgi:hypothetical protein